MCQHSEPSGVVSGKRKEKMKESQQVTNRRRRPHHVGTQRDTTKDTSAPPEGTKVLKRHRDIRVSPTEEQLAAPNCARYTAYQCERLSFPIPETLVYSNNDNERKNKHTGSKASVKRVDNCSSPPAKIAVSYNLVYAGAKFNDAPAPKELPKPPSHWVAFEAKPQENRCAEITDVLKVMLKVPAGPQQIKVRS